MATTAIPKTKISGGSFLLEERQTADVFTPEDFSEQQQMIGQTTEEFANNEILPQADKIEHKDFSISRLGWQPVKPCNVHQIPESGTVEMLTSSNSNFTRSMSQNTNLSDEAELVHVFIVFCRPCASKTPISPVRTPATIGSCIEAVMDK